jgi:hypothetical protein
MSEPWQYQIRVDVAEAHADTLRSRPDEPAVAALTAILARHNAKATCQYDAFAGYCAEAEREGIEQYALYDWTKATIEDPVKKAKYLKSFTLYVDGSQVYPKAQADALEAELQPLVGGGVIERLHKYDTNPANNPQPPRRPAA